MIAPLSDLCKLLSMPNVEDVGIIGEDPKEIFWVATRSDLLQFLHLNRTLIYGTMQIKIKDCTLNKVSTCVAKHEFAIEAFQACNLRSKLTFISCFGPSKKEDSV